MPAPTRRALTTRLLPAAAAALAAPTILRPTPAQAATAAEITAEVNAALVSLRERAETRNLFAQARATLIFPRIIQGGFVVGGQYGEGAALRGNTIQGYYNIAGASFGLLIGAQAAGLAMFFMTDEALGALMRADGWEIGTGPSVVVLDRGDQVNFTATTLREPVYAITFNQQGLMASISLNGTKISRINPS
ncbi:YSC84-related protein [Pararoseomonas indoligenes]|uniref:Lipid-binding SYLF domain-containing protein n=1 Tax=Roseomonas indoligenes TaxID=2820811 RepID=A0A940MZN8_9PROT|nr:lipid-binding SYLF domain-containing protein [Pararoseomonas indoligenes]MBP0493824.1 lipid-binding SYLF domain-containing protein [Pararoseomonas indoligenes]